MSIIDELATEIQILMADPRVLRKREEGFNVKPVFSLEDWEKFNLRERHPGDWRYSARLPPGYIYARYKPYMRIYRVTAATRKLDRERWSEAAILGVPLERITVYDPEADGAPAQGGIYQRLPPAVQKTRQDYIRAKLRQNARGTTLTIYFGHEAEEDGTWPSGS